MGHKQCVSNDSNTEAVSTTTESENSDSKDRLKEIRAKNINRVIIAHLNINSIRNKFELLSEKVRNDIDVLVISETKIDESFPDSQFLIDSFSTPFRMDRNNKGGGILVYVREDIPAKSIKIPYISKETECLAIELNLRKMKWLITCSYNPHKDNISNHLFNLSKILDNNLSKYERLLCIGDFNSEITEIPMKNFCDLYHLKSIVKNQLVLKTS